MVMARTLTTWGPKDGYVKVQSQVVAINPSSQRVAIMLPGCCLVRSHQPVNYYFFCSTLAQYICIIYKTASSQSPSDRATANNEADLLEPLASALVNSTFSVAQKNEIIMELCAKYPPMFSLSSKELGKCKTAVCCCNFSTSYWHETYQHSPISSQSTSRKGH